MADGRKESQLEPEQKLRRSRPQLIEVEGLWLSVERQNLRGNLSTLSH